MKAQTVFRDLGYDATVVVGIQVDVGEPTNGSSRTFPSFGMLHVNRLYRFWLFNHWFVSASPLDATLIPREASWFRASRSKKSRKRFDAEFLAIHLRGLCLNTV